MSRALLRSSTARELGAEVARLEEAIASLVPAPPEAEPQQSPSESPKPESPAVCAETPRTLRPVPAPEEPLRVPPEREYFVVPEPEPEPLPEIRGVISTAGVRRALVALPSGAERWLEEGEESGGWLVVHIDRASAVLIRDRPLASLRCLAATGR